jgi:nitrous oxide reductase accessory protein NosL
MKRILLCSIAALLLVGLTDAFGGGQDDIAQHPTCPYCGMDRAKFGHSRMLLKFDDESSLGMCSVHCAALHMALETDRSPVFYGVGDFMTQKLIDAEKAFWVIGGDKPGVMTGRAKWAFEKKSDADQFIQASGAQHATFEDVLEATYADMYKDTRLIREKRKMQREKTLK